MATIQEIWIQLIGDPASRFFLQIVFWFFVACIGILTIAWTAEFLFRPPPEGRVEMIKDTLATLIEPIYKTMYLALLIAVPLVGILLIVKLVKWFWYL